MKEQTCGCCEGIEKLTPQSITNRPSLKALAYRVGTHASFLETMLARLSDLFLEITEPSGSNEKTSLYPLRGLKTRDRGDAAIAWLDSWATVADVLTFYQERIANEGFLGTAIERRSILELARLVGYRLRPGVAATVYLAFELEKNQNVEIPKGIRAQSIPGPGEMPQAFETSAPLEAKFIWNSLKPRLTQPQDILLDRTNLQAIDSKGQRKLFFFFKGITANLKPNDPLLLIFLSNKVLYFVDKVEVEANENRTKIIRQLSFDDYLVLTRETVDAFIEPENFGVDPNENATQILLEILMQLKNDLISLKSTGNIRDLVNLLNDTLPEVKGIFFNPELSLSIMFKDWIRNIVTALNEILYRISSSSTSNLPEATIFEKLQILIAPLLKLPSLQPLNPLRRPVSVGRSFSNLSDIGPQLLVAQNPELKNALYEAWRNTTVSATSELKDIVTFRVKAAPFGHNAALQAKVPQPDKFVTYQEWTFEDSDLPLPDKKTLNLDNQYKEIKSGSWIIVEHAKHSTSPKFLQVNSIQTVSISGFGLSGKVIQLTLDKDWYEDSWLEQINVGTPAAPTWKHTISLLRQITVFAQSEPLELVEEPIEDLVAGDAVELDGLFDGLKSGRWLVVSGERVDLTAGSQSDKVRASELVMLTAITHDANPDLPGDTPHTTLHFANSLAYQYQRDTVTINANVAHATQGETRAQVLGSGDSSKAFQEFKLSSAPLTYIPAIASSGIESTLEVRVNNVLWRESDSISELDPTDRRYITRQDNEGNTFVIFGNGERGARLPTGIENVKAVYRSGIGKAGNVTAEQISLLATRPLGVKGVLNPQPASGGADPESANSGRHNATVALKALDRAVSVQDYADFARAFAGIGKASASRLSDGRRDLVHLTITGADDIPISKNSDLYRNLQQSLFRFGDPHQALQIDVRDLLLIVISARVKIFPELLWEVVEPRIRAAVLDTFGFHNRELGQYAFRSELTSAIEAVEGVDFVDVDRFDALSYATLVANLELLESSIKSDIDRIPVELARVDLTATDPAKRIKPAQLAYLSPVIPDTLILMELT